MLLDSTLVFDPAGTAITAGGAATNKTNVLLRLEEFDGKVITSFRGVPIRIVDQLLSTEARVV